jgi:hypothetical protein
MLVHGNLSPAYCCPVARMTPGEANAVNIIASYIAAQPESPPAQVARALEILANRAHNRIQTGWDENAVRRQWPQAFTDSAVAPPGD